VYTDTEGSLGGGTDRAAEAPKRATTTVAHRIALRRVVEATT
jgi:hypothetical protein